MISKENRLRNRDDFQKAYTQGKFFSSGPLIVRIIKNSISFSRFGLAIGKNYSKKAVERNNAKRILRAAIAPFTKKIIPGFDLIVAIRKPLPGQKVNVKEISERLRLILEKNNLLK